MATTRNTKKTTVTETNEVVEDVVETIKTTTSKKKLEKPDYVLCRSVCAGGLNVISKSGELYEFRDYGTTCEIEYHDLVALIRKHSEHVYMPRFVIEDEYVLNEFPQLQKIYDELLTKGDILEILNLPIGQMETELSKLPSSMTSTVCNLVSTQIANGKIDSVRKIRALSDFYGSDFNFLSELFR